MRNFIKISLLYVNNIRSLLGFDKNGKVFNFFLNDLKMVNSYLHLKPIYTNCVYNGILSHKLEFSNKLRRNKTNFVVILAFMRAVFKQTFNFTQSKYLMNTRGFHEPMTQGSSKSTCSHFHIRPSLLNIFLPNSTDYSTK